MTVTELDDRTSSSHPAQDSVRLSSVSKVCGAGHNSVAALRELSLTLAKG